MPEKTSLIYEDENFLAVYKPAGILVHRISDKRPRSIRQLAELRGRQAKREKTLVDWLLKRYPEIKNVGDPSTSSGQVNLRPGVVHRLDKDTSGILLVAKNQDYFNYLKNLFQTGQIRKTYLALVWGELKTKSGFIKKPIRLKSGTTKRTVWRGKVEKEAITEYRVLKCLYYPRKSAFNPRESAYTLMRVWPKTGRTHQIRIHLASIGHPIVGDSLYGPKTNLLGLNRQFLHAESLEFNLENSRRIKLEVGLPDDLKSVLKRLTNK